ncbi:uncharacterized protein KY384_002457 [Bacidia gigantensis]|uniref:uncharacterized protein n=1 Tax=Bacidia gigantensis TaxID=2732470 RepID=UPI001D05B735|nr:uncharacterized protein KY384_002457 [Bacidia gigantensis]KAG8532580.1 hypothetical protein KY384_002457 [Bacidia gigantensis]
MSLSRHCLRPKHNAFAKSRSVPCGFQKRTLFGLGFSKPRQPRPANLEPGIKNLMELEQAIKADIRTPPSEEIADAFRTYVKHRQKVNRVDEVQLHLLQMAYSTLKKDASLYETKPWLSLDDIRRALAILSFRPPRGFQSDLCIDLSRMLFEDTTQEYETAIAAGQSDESFQEGFKDVILSYIKVLSYHSKALVAQDVVKQYRKTLLKDSDYTAWSPVVRGLVLEERDQDLESLVEYLQKNEGLFEPEMYSDIIFHYARFRNNPKLTRTWYDHPAFTNKSPTSKAIIAVLGQCIKEDELEWGDSIVKNLMQEDLEKKELIDMTLRWAAAKGRGVDEIGKMMEVIARRYKDRPDLQPNITTINLLIRLAIQKKNDPYTAERYINLGQKLGFEPDAATYLLQLDYRVKVDDLSGAMAAYTSLRAQDLSRVDNIHAINRLIVAFCERRPSEYDTIMSIVDDLADRNAQFTPDAVAALSRLHLQRDEIADAQDLLNAHAYSLGPSDRRSVQQVLIDHIKGSKTTSAQAWDTYKMMRRIFHETPAEIFIDIMQAFFTRGRSDMACYCFGHMRQSPNKALRPTTDTYALCLAGIGKYGDDRALELVHNLLKLDNEIEPDTMVRNGLMLAYMGCDESDDALAFWQDIVESQEGPSYASIRIALRCCERAQHVGEEAVRQIWKRITDSEMEVTREIYAAYLGALAGRSLFEDCVKVCKEAGKYGFEVDAFLIGSFFNGAWGVKDKQDVRDWIREMYPEPYLDLIKHGMFCTSKGNADGSIDEEEEGIEVPEEIYGTTMLVREEKEYFFDIGHLGWDLTL